MFPPMVLQKAVYIQEPSQDESSDKKKGRKKREEKRQLFYHFIYRYLFPSKGVAKGSVTKEKYFA